MKIGILITGHPPENMMDGGAYDKYFARLLGDDEFTYQAVPMNRTTGLRRWNNLSVIVTRPTFR